jgi:hypothetical protein
LKIAFCYSYKSLRSMILKDFPKAEVTFFGVQEFLLVSLWWFIWCFST